jgi:chromosome partitioning protein
MKTVAFFNNKGGVGKTTLVYHLAWMLAERGEQVLAVDMDPQANLTAMFLPEEDLEDLWPMGEHPKTIFGALRPMMSGLGDVDTPHVEAIDDRIGLIVGDLELSTLQDTLSAAWLQCHFGEQQAFAAMTALHRVIQRAAASRGATWILVDVGPDLGAINRAAVIACQYVLIPVAAHLSSLHGLRNVGASLRTWRAGWRELEGKNPDALLAMPKGDIEPLGYVVMQHGPAAGLRHNAYQRWLDRFPAQYRESVLDESPSQSLKAEDDPYCLAMLKHYRSLMPMAMEARKPVFALKPADGAIGAHGKAVQHSYQDFLALGRRIADRCGAVLN